MVTVVPAMVHDPEAVIVAVVVALVVAETMSCELKYADAGAPVKVTAGVPWFTISEAEALLAAKLPCAG